MKRLFLAIGLCVTLSIGAATFPNVFTTNSIGNPNQFSQSGGTASIGIGAKTTNLVTFGSTNYFANDIPVNTNGPRVMYRTTGSGTYSNFVDDVVLDNNGAFRSGGYTFQASSTLGDGAYGGFSINTLHNGAVPQPANTEWQFGSPSHFSFGPGTGSPAAGHFQFGIGTGFRGYSLNNVWGYWQQQIPLSQSSPTGFSAALVWRTEELQGAADVNHWPGIFSYSIRTNAPSRYALAFTTDLGNGGSEAWDPNTAKAGKVMQLQSGDITNALFFKPINYPTNLGTVALDCSIPMSDQSTAVNITFTAPLNFDPLGIQYEHFYQIITNFAAGTITLTAPANARLIGTTTVTRMCQVEWFIKLGKWTNGVVTQWF